MPESNQDEACGKVGPLTYSSVASVLLKKLAEFVQEDISGGFPLSGGKTGGKLILYNFCGDTVAKDPQTTHPSSVLVVQQQFQNLNLETFHHYKGDTCLPLENKHWRATTYTDPNCSTLAPGERLPPQQRGSRENRCQQNANPITVTIFSSAT